MKPEELAKPYQQQSHYELLEVPVTATTEEIQAAYQRAMELYGPGSLALAAGGGEEQTQELRGLLRRAVDTLTDETRRKEYDAQQGGSSDSALAAPVPAPVPTQEERPVSAVEPQRGLASAQLLASEGAIANAEAAMAQVASRVKSQLQRPKPLDISDDAELNGELLRRARETLGFSLAHVADRTRISTRHLQNVEADKYEALPAPVYLRGILMSLAREYRLDPVRIAKGYLTLVERFQQRG